MMKTIGIAAIIAVGNAIKLETEKFQLVTEEGFWSKDNAEFNKIKEAGTKWTDPNFPPDNTSLGVVGADSANSQSHGNN